MRAAVWIALLLTLPLGMEAATRAAATRHPYRRHPYVTQWRHATVGKRAVAGVGAHAGVAQLRHQPRKWGGGASGFGKRLGAGMATHAVGTTVEHAVAAPLHEKLSYERSTKRGVAPRLGHALASTVVVRNTRNGRRRPAVGRLSGHAAAGAFSQAALSAGSGASTAGVGLAADAGANVAREFIPRHPRHRLRVHRPAPRN